MPYDSQGGITIEYLIELISSVKSALNNINDKNSSNHEILTELSQTLNVLTELYKKQNQDQKTNQVKLEEVIKGLQKISSEMEISKQQILSSNESVNSKVSVINEFKKESLDDLSNSILTLNETTLALQGDITYLKNRETQKEVISNIEDKKKSEVKKISEDKEESIFSKIIGLLKTMSSNIGDIYKIMMLVAGVLFVALWLMGYITSEDLKNIVKLKFF